MHQQMRYSAETHHLPPHYDNIHCLVYVNVNQAWMNVNECNFFLLHGGLQWHIFSSYTFQYQTPFSQIVPLLPSAQKKKKKNWIELNIGGNFNILYYITTYHQHPPLTSWASMPGRVRRKVEWDFEQHE